MEAYVLEDILEVGAGEGRRTKGCAGSAAADEPSGKRRDERGPAGAAGGLPGLPSLPRGRRAPGREPGWAAGLPAGPSLPPRPPVGPARHGGAGVRRGRAPRMAGFGDTHPQFLGCCRRRKERGLCAVRVGEGVLEPLGAGLAVGLPEISALLQNDGSLS